MCEPHQCFHLHLRHARLILQKLLILAKTRSLEGGASCFWSISVILRSRVHELPLAQHKDKVSGETHLPKRFARCTSLYQDRDQLPIKVES